MSERSDKAVAAFQEGFSCSQAVLSAFCEELGMGRATGLKVSSAFGGGIASTGNLCGAVSGGLMAIGLKHGRTRADDLAAKEKTYSLANAFMDEFRARHGSIVCRELLGCDLGTAEGKAEIKAKNHHGTTCTMLVRDAAELLEKVL
jgi:C_GCAxxG_C_C family probable redox protein